MKHPHHQSYPPEATELCEKALLTIWPKLADFHSDLALVGGLVPRYLCHRTEMASRTLDVDLAISLAAEGEHSQPLSWRLRSEGFDLDRSRFKKEIGKVTLYLDFLTESPPPGGSIRMVDDIPANAFPGVERALTLTRSVDIAGSDLSGAEVTETIRVCEAGPFLCLKLYAYAQRAEAKDLFDLMQVLTAYDLGLEAAVASFRSEKEINPAYPLAEKILQERFLDPKGKAAIDFADFCIGALRAQFDPTEYEFRAAQLSQSIVTAGRRLLQS